MTEKLKKGNFKKATNELLLLPPDAHKLLMQWKGPYKVISRCGKSNDYWVKMNKKVKTLLANMLKKIHQKS